MKFINKIVIIALVIGGLSACGAFDMDLQDNPNEITPDKASLNDVYNNIQLSFGGVYGASQGSPGAAARMYHAGAFTYNAFTTPNTFNGLWNTAYAGLFPDVDALLEINEGKGFDIHDGTAMIMKAYTLMVLVDLMGDVPYSESGQGTDIISPRLDPGTDVYGEAMTLLDAAIARLDGTEAGAPAFDNFYDGDPVKWITFAKTLKLRAALNMGNGGMVSSIVAGGDFIDDPSEDFQVNFGSQRNNPNSRHPFYNSHYETGDGAYISNYYMWLLRADKVNGAGATVVDPRIRYYFYRKVDDSENQDLTTYSCNFSAGPDQSKKPAHWDPRIPYCYGWTDGYIGRDHLNGSGTPPDGPVRTSYGLYPGGGDFDDDTFDDTRTSGVAGGLGQGIFPIMMSSFVDLMRAEAALTLGTSDDARALLESGIRASLDKVEGFESLVSSKMGSEVTLRNGDQGTIKELYGMDAGSKDSYVAEVLALYDAAGAAEKLNIVVKEYYIAAWGNGLEAYNMYRRTGYPSPMEPSLEPDPGQFPNSFFLPVDHVSRNSNVDQKVLADRVFWNASGPDVN